MSASIDHAADKAEHDAARGLIDAMSERQQWIVYLTLYNQGLRVDAALHAIERLAPRMTGGV